MNQNRQIPQRFFALTTLIIVAFVLTSLFLFPLEGQGHEIESANRISRWATSEVSPFDTSRINVQSKSDVVADESSDIDTLLQKSRDQGAVRVLVQLSVPLQLEGDLSLQESEQQRQAIVQAQDAFLAEMAEHEGVTLIRQYTYSPLLAVELDEPALLTASRLRIVRSIQEDMLVPPTLYESIPIIKADEAWTSGYTGSGYTIAVLDTGVDKTHPFLAGKIVSEACFSSTSDLYQATSVCPNGQDSQIGDGAGVNCPTDISGCPHGTHVAGIAAGSNANFSGVAKDATVIAIQVFTRIDSEERCGDWPSPCVLTFHSDWIAGLEHVYALRNSYNISSANMSLGRGEHKTHCDTWSGKSIIDSLRSAGIATVISSGNDGYIDAVGYPACISTAITVGNTTKTDVVYNGSNSASIVDLLAPGTYIYSSVPGGSYQRFTGTSMAAPHVAGAWAVHKQHSPGASVSQILNTLESTGVPITDSRNGIVKPRIEFHLSPVQTATPTPTPSSTPGSGSCSNIMRDGSFESDPLLDWYGSGSTYQYPDAAYFGNYSILMGYNVDEESLLWQEQAVPSNLTSSSVSFWYYLSTQESGSTPYDHFVVSIRNAAGTVTWATIAQLDNTDVTSAWSHFDYTLTSSQLAAIAGQSGRIEFRLTNDYSLVTQVYVDDVVWNVCSSGPGSIATPTSTRPPSTTPTYTPTPSGTLDPVFLPVIIK